MTVSPRKKILFLAEGITMTHFARPAALAETLDPSEWDVYFWTPKRYHPLLRQTFTRLGDLKTIDPNVFLDSLAHARVAYSADALRAYVHDDQEIFRDIRPDMVIGDYRLSLCISAPHCGVPFASIYNAQWSPCYKQPAIVPELPVTRWVPPRLLNLLYSVLRPSIYARHAKPVNDVRRSFGLPEFPPDLRFVFTSGDLVLYPDVPRFLPLSGLPPHHHYIGACLWTPSIPTPPWWNQVMGSSLPKIFVSLGSSGPVKVLPAVLEALSGMPVQVLLSTSGRSVGQLPFNVFSAELLPYEETARQCAAVVSHGGTGGLYATLASGTPMLAIPSNVDNSLSTDLLEKCGAGIGIRVEYATADRLRGALNRLLAEPSFKVAAGLLAEEISRYETRRLFPNLLRQWFAKHVKAA